MNPIFFTAATHLLLHSVVVTSVYQPMKRPSKLYVLIVATIDVEWQYTLIMIACRSGQTNTTVDGSRFRQNLSIFPSNFATCHAHIRHDFLYPSGNFIPAHVKMK